MFSQWKYSSVKNQLDIFKFNFDSFHLCVSECGLLCKKWNFLFEFDEVWSWQRFYRCVTAWKCDLAPRSAIKLSIQWPLPPSSAISTQEYLIAIQKLRFRSLEYLANIIYFWAQSGAQQVTVCHSQFTQCTQFFIFLS